MERLEAAMAKARAARRKARGVADEGILPVRESAVLVPPQAYVVGFSDDNWTNLRPLEISPEMAERKRLSALMGAQHSVPYDILRARVQKQMKDQSWSRIAITSPNQNCGKTTISLNLAFCIARQPELRVLLLDFDLRRPSMAKALGHTAPDNLIDVLEGRVDFGTNALRFGKNLAICTNHTSVQNSAELLQAPMTKQVLDDIEARWKPDVMIFDTPPLLGNDDNLGFLGQVDCALLVAAAGSSTITQIDSCEKELAGLTNVVGTVLNKCRYNDPGSTYDQSYY